MSSDHTTYRVTWSPEDQEHVGMRAAREGETETVTLDQLQAVLDADN